MSELMRGVLERRQEEAKQAIYRKLQEEFSERLSVLRPWREVNIWHPYDLNSNMLRFFSKEMIRNACVSLGLRVYCVNYGHIHVSIPNPIKGKELTKAQEMLQEFNTKFTKYSEEARASAKKECDKLIVKLLNKEYSAISHLRNGTRITIGYFEPFSPKYSETHVFYKEIYEIMRPHGVSRISFNWSDRFNCKVATWTLFVDDNQFSFK